MPNLADSFFDIKCTPRTSFLELVKQHQDISQGDYVPQSTAQTTPTDEVQIRFLGLPQTGGRVRPILTADPKAMNFQLPKLWIPLPRELLL